jgi:protein gp37
MSATTIEWTQRPGTVGETWNPTTGCNKVDRGCKNCYAETMHRRLQAMGQAKYKLDFLEGAQEQPDTLDIPMRWTKPRTVFVNSMSDLFHEQVSFEFITEVMQVIQMTPQHTYLVLTKRPEVALRYWYHMDTSFKLANGKSIGRWRPPSNLLMGTSVHDQESANKRVSELLALHDCLHFLSYEPAIGPLDLKHLQPKSAPTYRTRLDALRGIYSLQKWKGKEWHQLMDSQYEKLDWVIMGGESGPKADPMHPAWARAMRDQCKEAGVPFFFKQWGAWQPVNYRRENQELYIKFELGKNERLFEDPMQNMVRVGKGNAGHELDGEVYQQFPELPTFPQT